MKLSASQLTAMLVSKRIHDQIVSVWTNLFFNGYSVDHIYDRKGNGVLAFRIRDNALQVRDQVIAVLEKAQKAGDQAFEQSYSQIGDRDCCGFAWVNVHGIRKNSKLGKVLMEHGFDKDYTGALQLWARYPTQSMTPKERGMQAYAKVLREELEIEAYMGSRMD